MADAKWKPSKTDKSERLLQLTCALLFAERGLTKQELFAAIKVYADDVASGLDAPSLDRKFERDKADLRSTGIQVVTANPNADPDEIRYIIAEDTFVWPQHVELSGKQLQLLKLAAQVWAQASMQDDAGQALVRLRALGIEPAAEDLIGYAPRINTHEPSFVPLSHAIDDRTVVTFDYRKADGAVESREVQPWSLHSIDGQWLLQCFDVKRKEPRNFLLKRIVSKVTTKFLNDEPQVFDEPSLEARSSAENDLRQLIASQVAELRIARDSQAWFHFRLDDQPNQDAEFGTAVFQYMDLHLLAEELRDFALDIKIVRPKELAEIMRAGLEKVASDHA